MNDPEAIRAHSQVLSTHSLFQVYVLKTPFMDRDILQLCGSLSSIPPDDDVETFTMTCSRPIAGRKASNDCMGLRISDPPNYRFPGKWIGIYKVDPAGTEEDLIIDEVKVLARGAYYDDSKTLLDRSLVSNTFVRSPGRWSCSFVF